MRPQPSQLIEKYLACPKCRADMRVDADRCTCMACGEDYELRDGVFIVNALAARHYFDDKHQVMQHGNESPEIQELCYDQQSAIAKELVCPGEVVLDIGCGPTVHFKRPPDSILIGVDPSLASLKANQGLDLGVFCGAEAMPFRDKSVDRIFCFYSIHHMVGQSVKENTANLGAALRECGRVIREGGTLVIFDMSPWWPVWHVEKLAWNRARRLLSDRLDMFFWRGGALERLAATAFTSKAFESRSFSVSPFLTFPPVFSLPGLKLPRFLYPFDTKMYKWSF